MHGDNPSLALTVLPILEELRLTNSPLVKIETLKKYKENYALKKAFFLTYNPYINYYVRRLRTYQVQSFWTEGQDYYLSIEEVLKNLSDRNYTGNAAIAYLSEFIQKNPAGIGELLLLILERDLKAGITTGFNKVFKGTEFEIPDYELMLAQTDKPDFPIVIEEKFDGVRFICEIRDKVAIFYTRNGKTADFTYLKNQLLNILELNNIILDGEITGKDRQSVSGLVNKFIQETAPENLDKDFVYNVFDTLSINDWDTRTSAPFHFRRANLIDMLQRKQTPNIQLVESKLCQNSIELDAYYEEIIARRGEGIIAKVPSGLYEWKRSSNWLKFKEVRECDLQVVGIVPGEKGTKRDGKVGSLSCITSDGLLEVNVGSGLDDDMVERLLTENPIGKIMKVIFNAVIKSKTSDKHSLFLPRFIEFRFDKDIADTLEQVNNAPTKKSEKKKPAKKAKKV